MAMSRAHWARELRDQHRRESMPEPWTNAGPAAETEDEEATESSPKAATEKKGSEG